MKFFKRFFSILKVDFLPKHLDDDDDSTEQEEVKKQSLKDIKPKLQYLPDWVYLPKNHDFYLLFFLPLCTLL